MDYTIDAGAGTTEILLSGHLTFADHEKFRDVLTAISEAKGERTVLDLSALEFADSSGLGMFMIAHDAARKANKQFRIRGARNEVKRLMTLARFERKFDLDD